MVSIPFFGSALGWLGAILLIGVILFIHESGHYLAAVLSRVKIEEFGFGMPPRLFKLFTWRGTDFTINAIPFGAFVRPKGEDDPTVEGGLAAATKRVRLLVLMGGVTANLLAGFAAFTIVSKMVYPDSVYIEEVAAGSPAAEAGVLPGDQVVAVDGIAVETSDSLIQHVYERLGQPVTYVVERSGKSIEIRLTPRTEWPEGQGPTGVVLSQHYSDTHSWGEAAVRGARSILDQVLLLVRLPMMLIQGQISLSQSRPVGVVGLVDITEQVITTASKYDQWVLVLNWMGLVNIALAVGNLLPIPGVDGGRILFLLIEAVRKRRVDPARERAIITVSMLILFSCLGVVTMLDIFFPVLPR